MTDPAEYEAYMREEWLLFSHDASRQNESSRVMDDAVVRRVLDVGCGAGQEMIPFATRGAACVGIDITHSSGIFGNRIFGEQYPGSPVRFVTSAAEQLPFSSAAFDVVLCRVSIPYTNNREALSEIARADISVSPAGALRSRWFRSTMPFFAVQTKA